MRRMYELYTSNIGISLAYFADTPKSEYREEFLHPLSDLFRDFVWIARMNCNYLRNKERLQAWKDKYYA